MLPVRVRPNSEAVKLVVEHLPLGAHFGCRGDHAGHQLELVRQAITAGNPPMARVMVAHAVVRPSPAASERAITYQHTGRINVTVFSGDWVLYQGGGCAGAASGFDVPLARHGAD